MVVVWILLGIVALFWLLLTTPVRIFLTYDKDLHYKLKYGPFSLYDSAKPSKPKKKKNALASKGKSASKKKSSTTKILLDFLGLTEISSIANFKYSVKKCGIVGTLQAVGAAVGRLYSATSGLIRKGRFKKFDLKIVVGDTDSGDAALLYGQVCAIAFPLFSFLEKAMRFKEQKVDIRCDYELEETSAFFRGRLDYRPWHFLCFFWRLFINYLKTKKENLYE